MASGVDFFFILQRYSAGLYLCVLWWIVEDFLLEGSRRGEYIYMPILFMKYVVFCFVLK